MKSFYKKSQRGGAGLIALAVVGVLVALIAIAVGIFVAANNTAVAAEEGIDAQYQANQTVLANYTQKIAEAAQVPGMMTEDMQKVAKAAIEGRYGDKGSQAMFQSIREQNPVVSEALYIKLQTIIEAGRDEFKNNQNTLTDKVRVYKTQLGQMPGGLVMRFMGFPRKDLDKYKPIITQGVETTYQTGKEAAPVQLRPTAK